MLKLYTTIIIFVLFNAFSSDAQSNVYIDNKQTYDVYIADNQLIADTPKINNSAIINNTELAQDTISKKENGYFLGSKPISKKELADLLKSNSVSNKVLKKSETWSYVLMVPAIVGGFMVGYSLGHIIAGRAHSEPVLGAGLGIVTVTLISSALIDNSIQKKAIKAYNNSKKISTNNP